MKRIVVWIIIVLLFTTFSIAQDRKKRIAVLDFDFSSIQRWWESNWDIGNGVSDLIVKNLVRDGTFSVIERRALDSILAEQNFSNSDRANASTAAQIGKVLGVDAIVVGSITQFGTEKKKRSFGGFGGSIGGYGVGKVGTSEGKAKVQIDARVVDVNTGEILAVADGVAESKRKGLLLGGAGGSWGRGGGGSIDMGSSDFRETILGEATHAAVEELSVEIIDSENRIKLSKIAVKGQVAYAEEGLIILNVGSNHGVHAGMELSVVRVKKVIKDPATGRVLRELVDDVAKIRITKSDAGSSEAQLISGSGIKIGDTVRN
jgi:curli biogenesis system outer membrane secretion channel CsgG